MQNKNRVLIVDDNPMNLAVLEEALDGRYEIALAEEGTTALTIAPSFQPDVVLLDVMMPGRNGFDVCATLKSHHELRKTRIIMVSAKAELSARLQGYDAGADDYVIKPFCEEELLTKIEFALRTKRLEGLCGGAGEMLALLSELRDTSIDPYMQDVRALSQRLAMALKRGSYASQIDDQFVDNLHQASVLRDVGILAVPEAVRSQRGKLAIDEIEQLKQHTLIGSRLLNRLANENPEASFFHMAAEVARSHHENYDGSGYPDAIAGEDIPLAARIVRVAETVCDIVHRPANSQVALSYDDFDSLFEGSGKRYDPLVADAVQDAICKLAEGDRELKCSFS